MLHGIDVSAWQHDDPDKPTVDWTSVREAGIQFAMLKATQGIDYVNPYLGTDAEQATRNRILVGAYHYAVPGAALKDDIGKDATAQAVYACEAVADLPLPLGLACDLEEAGTFQTYQLAEWFQAWAAEVESFGSAPALCVEPPMFATLGALAGGARLWLRLGTKCLEDVPENASPWMLQTVREEISGVVGEVDLQWLLRPRGANPVVAKSDKAVITLPKHMEEALDRDRGGDVGSE